METLKNWARSPGTSREVAKQGDDGNMPRSSRKLWNKRAATFWTYLQDSTLQTLNTEPTILNAGPKPEVLDPKE